MKRRRHQPPVWLGGPHATAGSRFGIRPSRWLWHGLPGRPGLARHARRSGSGDPLGWFSRRCTACCGPLPSPVLGRDRCQAVPRQPFQQFRHGGRRAASKIVPTAADQFDDPVQAEHILVFTEQLLDKVGVVKLGNRGCRCPPSGSRLRGSAQFRCGGHKAPRLFCFVPQPRHSV
jgi:hypothetical protein